MSALREKPSQQSSSFGPDDFDRMWRGDGRNDGDFEDGNNNQPERNPPPEGYQIGMRLTLASITMLFLALSSAYIVNRARLQPLATPRALYFSTAILVTSSVTIELARRAVKHRLNSKFKIWICLTMILGLIFLGSQLFAWQELATRGFYLSRNTHSGYAYIFTAMHGVHLIGGLFALIYVAFRSPLKWTTVRRRVVVDSVALYWHFLDGLWIYLLAIIFLWR